MNIRQVLNELKAQRRQLDKAIAALERVAIAPKSRQKNRSAPVQSLKGAKLLLFKPRRPAKAKLQPDAAERTERH